MNRWRKRMILLALIIMIHFAVAPGWAAIRVGNDHLEIGGEVLGQAMSEEEMEGKRGAFLGVQFAVLFEGFWDTLGNSGSTLLSSTENTGTGTTNTYTAPPPGTAVKIEAYVGGFGTSRGIYQITQVPGSGNVVTSNLVVNIRVIQVLGDSLSSLSSLLWP